MTPLEIFLTVAVVVLAFVSVTALVLAFCAWGSADKVGGVAEEANDRSIKLAEVGRDHASACGREQARLDDLGRELGNHKREIAKFIELASKSEEKRDQEVASLKLCVKELAAQRLPVHASHELLTAIEAKVEALQREVERHRHKLGDDEPTCLGDDPPVPLFIEQDETEAA